MSDDVTESLRESEERYRTLFEQSPVGVFFYDRDLVIREFNARFVEILQSTPERLRGLPMRNLKDQRILPTLERGLTGETAFYEGPYEATTGAAHLYLSMRATALRDGTGRVVGAMGVAEDVTARARATSALQASEQRLVLHVRRSPLGVIGIDTQGTIVEWNASAERIFGWSEREAIGRGALDLLVPPWARDKIADVLRALSQRAGGERSINENLTKDGRVILCDWYNTWLVDDGGQIIGFAHVVDDITERHQAEHALKRSEVRFRTLIENAPDAIVVYPPDDRRLVYANGAFAAMLGHDSPAELLGRTIDELVHPEDRATIERRWLKLVEAHGALPPQEYRMLRKDGGLVFTEVMSMFIEYDERPHVIAFLRDISERKQMQAHLLVSDRMASVGTLAAGVAHEINNPLAYAMTNLEAVATRRLPRTLERLRELGGEAAAASEEIARAVAMLDIAREGCDRVRDIVRDLKTFARGPEEERRLPIDVRRVLDASINVAWNEIRHRARLVKEYEDVPPVLATEARLGQVFLNLLVNAAQALPVGGAAEHVIAVRTRVEGDWVNVTVTDTGPGVPPENASRIFEPFFTTKPVGVGTGLGLWICQGIVTSLAGRISVEAAPGGGATFRVALPALQGVEPSAVTAHAASSATPTAESPRLRILVVDDEIAIGRTLSIALADEFDVATAASGREALTMLTDARYDVVLCDLMMPDVSGMDVFERIAEKDPALARRFVFVTGGAFTERARSFVEQAHGPVIEKPFELTRLPALLRARARAASR